MVTAISIDANRDLRSLPQPKIWVEGRGWRNTIRAYNKTYVEVRDQQTADTIDRLMVHDRVLLAGPFALRHLKSVEFRLADVILATNALADSGLEHIELPKDAMFYDAAFMNCRSLKSATIPEKMDTVPAYAFENDAELETLTVHGKITDLGEYCFDNCRKLKFTIPETVQRIGAYAMAGMDAISDVTIPVSCTYVGGMAFSYSKIKHLNIKNPDTEIQPNAFWGCQDIKRVEIAGKVYAVKHDCDNPYIVMSEPERVHGIDVMRVARIGEQNQPDKYKYYAMADWLFYCHENRDAALARVRSLIMAEHCDKYLKSLDDVTPEYRLNISAQELYCSGLAQGLGLLRTKHLLKRYDCDNCLKSHPTVYNECMHRHFKDAKQK
ncbi:leucine-rich repeat domain-containing protein [bacterium]|nr:leucine-rich repeat domain-containing protein [bacterium]